MVWPLVIAVTCIAAGLYWSEDRGRILVVVGLVIMCLTVAASLPAS
jgi:hypothetical protein